MIRQVTRTPCERCLECLGGNAAPLQRPAVEFHQAELTPDKSYVLRKFHLLFLPPAQVTKPSGPEWREKSGDLSLKPEGPERLGFEKGPLAGHPVPYRDAPGSPCMALLPARPSTGGKRG